METVFWDSHGVILIDYLQKGKTITGAYYAFLLDKLKVEIADKRPHLQKKEILFHQDNTSSRASTFAIAKIRELRIELLDHPPYSPDLAPSDFFLFPQLKTALGEQRFLSNEEVIREQLFCREERRVLFGRIKEMGASLGEVYRVTRRLCRK